MTTPPAASDARDLLRHLDDRLEALRLEGEAHLKAYRSEYDHIGGPSGVCPTCDDIFGEAHLLREARALLVQQEQDYESLRRIYNEVCDERVGAVRELSALQSRLEAAEARVRMSEHQVDRYALCPDHRDKATGRCIVCQAEERTRQELRALRQSGGSQETPHE